MSERQIDSVVRDRRLTPEEAAHYDRLREQVRDEWPEIERRIKARLVAGPVVGPVVEELKRTRAEKGLSLAEVSRRSGLKPATLEKLESGTGATPSVRTLERYANAMGKRIELSVVDEVPAAG